MNVELFERGLDILRQLTEEGVFEQIFVMGSAAANLHIFSEKGIYGPLSDIDVCIDDDAYECNEEAVFEIINERLGGEGVFEPNYSAFSIYYKGIQLFDVFLNNCEYEEELEVYEGIYLLSREETIKVMEDAIPTLVKDFRISHREL